MTERKIRFYPDELDAQAEEGENLLRVALDAGVYLNASCGGEGTCGRCKVLIEDGEVSTERSDRLSAEEYDKGYRQACQTTVLTDLTVRIPPESQLEKHVRTTRHEDVAATRVESRHVQEDLSKGWLYNPAVRKFYVELDPPSAGDSVSDLSRLLRGLKLEHSLDNVSVDFRIIKTLSHALREADWKITATVALTRAESQLDEYQLRGSRKPKLIKIDPGDTRDRHYSIVIDVGTTSVWGQLLDLNEATVLAESSDYNGQISYGADVLTRIVYTQKPGGLQELQNVVVSTINGIIADLLKQAEVDIRHVSHLAAAGNTTMTQILLGLDPKYIREMPYTPVANFLPPVRAIHLGIDVGEQIHLYTFPLVASYVGGDIVSGILGSGVYQQKARTLYIDVGTNGEIVLGNSDWLMTTACSAGPAFEGGGIKHGMRAALGAIEDFRINPTTYEPMIFTIGKVKPRGICGSGLIDLVAELLEAGAIGQNGKFNTNLPTDRVREGDSGYEYVVAWADETQTGQDIVITEVDIENLIRAKGAMYAGYMTLLENAGLTCSDLEQVIIAGNLGNNITLEKAITIGLLPDIPLDRFEFIGNGSLFGARLVSLSNEMLEDGERIARMMTNIELSDSPRFMDKYMAALFLPHTNLDDFPSVSQRLARLQEARSQR